MKKALASKMFQAAIEETGRQLALDRFEPVTRLKYVQTSTWLPPPQIGVVQVPEVIYGLFFERLAPALRKIDLHNSSYLNQWLGTLSSSLLDNIAQVMSAKASVPGAGEESLALNHTN